MKTFSGNKWSQNTDELSAFIAFLKSNGVRSYLEIGARHGDSFHAVMSSLPPGSMGVAVDLPGGAWGRNDSLPALDAAILDLRRLGYDVCRIIGNSRDQAIFSTVRNMGPFDAGLIDGDHRYEGVRADWVAYGRLCRIVAFHDIAGEGVTTGKGRLEVEVPRLWAEIKNERNNAEFIAPGSKMGIGVLW